MSATNVESPIEKANQINSKKQPKMGIENLEEFTIFPKQIIDGKSYTTYAIADYPVSVPNAPAQRFPATAAALPPEEPPGTLVLSKGFNVFP